jgi:hypothetical protein
VSVIIGFLNVFLWSANVWFLYKETKWYRPNPGKLGSSVSPKDIPVLEEIATLFSVALLVTSVQDP